MAGRAAAFSAARPHDRSHTAEFFYGLAISLSALASLPQPDGLGVWAEDGREIAFMLEYDTGSEHLAQLAGKLDGCARLADVMSCYHERLPLLVFGFLTPRAPIRSACASPLQLSTPQVTCPAGHVWMPLHGSGRQVRLIDLSPAIPLS
jgi:hypothetical protein